MSNPGILGFPQGAAHPKGLLSWPLGRGGYPDFEAETFNQVAAQSYFATVVAAGANAKGSWVAVCDPCPFDADGFVLSHSNHSAVADYLLDIGVGAVSTAVSVLVESIGVTGVSSASGNNSVAREAFFPVRIPAGSTVWARSQCASAGNQTLRCLFMAVRGGFHSYLREYLGDALPVTYGANTADSGGVEVDPGAGAANTKGAWADIGTTTRDHRAVMVVNQSHGIIVAQNARQDLAVGTGRTILIPDYHTNTAAVGSIYPGWHPLWFADIPAGTLLSARTMSGITTANRLTDVSVIGF